MKMKVSNLLAAPLVSVLLSLRTLPASARCDETEAPLGVLYFISEGQWNDNLPDGDFARLSIRPSANQGKPSFVETTVDYCSFGELVEYFQCVPRDGACLDVAVSQLPTGSYEISWDGSKVDVGPSYEGEFWNFTSTEVGDACVPDCAEGAEALFEYRYQAGVGFEDYRVEDTNGVFVLGCDSSVDECQEEYGRFADAVHTNRACLETDACYRLLVGDNFHRVPGYDPDHASVHSIQWEGSPMPKTAGKLYESIKFGDACEPDCDPGGESLVEFFMHRIPSGYCENYPDFPWELKMFDSKSGSWSTEAKGVVPSCSGTSLHYESMCVPKDSCVSFSVLSPKSSESMVPLYSLTMDGVIFKRKEMWVDDGLPCSEGLNHTTVMGRCTVAICEEPGEALFEVEMRTPSEYMYKNEFLPAIPKRLSWLLSPTKASTSNYTLDSHTRFDHTTTELGSVYQTIECVPDDECAFEFQTPSDSSAEYNLRRNNIELSNRDRDSYGSHRITLFGKDCHVEVESDAENYGTRTTYMNIGSILIVLGLLFC